MAFCVRSERKMEFQDNKPSVPGPGQYLKITLKNKLNEEYKKKMRKMKDAKY